MALETLTVTAELTPLDLLLWRHYRREVEGLVEDTLDRNPGLASKGLYLDVGTKVIVETPPPPPVGRAARPVIQLYE